MFGGVTGANDTNVSRTLYIYNISANRWSYSSIAENITIPVAVSGHTSHLIGNIMYVIFGHSPIYGYKNRVQEYHIGPGKCIIHSVGTGKSVIHNLGPGKSVIHNLGPGKSIKL